jgi:hypothetical protein
MELRNMTDDLNEMTRRISYRQSGRLVKFQDLFVRQKLEVEMSWAPANTVLAARKWEQKKREGDLPPTIKMAFLADGVGVQCVEISAVGGPGFRNVTLETIAGARNPVDIATDALTLWMGQAGENSWILVPKFTGTEHGERTGVLTRREARSEMLNKIREAEVIEVAKIYARNPTRGTMAVMEQLGLEENRVHRSRRSAQKLGLLPPSGSPKKEYESALERLAKMDLKPSDTEVKQALRKMKKGKAND